MAEPLLSIENLTVDYITGAGDVRVVDNVSLDVPEGGMLGLAGESGSGKTTIINAILRILKPPAAITGGRVLFRGRDLLDMDAAQLRQVRWREISLVPQSAMNALNPVMTIGEQIADVLQVHKGVSLAKGLRRAGELLELVGIDPTRVRSYPHELSGGMRQRVGIALALALEPPLVLMDEPTTALDVVVQREILARIATLQRELGFSVLFITHDLALMLQLCERVGVLYSGRLAELAPSRDLLTGARHPYTRALLAAVPELRGEGKLVGLGGAPPDLRSPPTGCRFHPRCSVAQPECSETPPPLVQLKSSALVACHLVQPCPQ